MTTASCDWGGDCPKTAVVSIGYLNPDDQPHTPSSWRPFCQEHATYLTVDPGCVDAARRYAAETGKRPTLTVVDHREPVACVTCGHIENAHRRYGCSGGGCDYDPAKVHEFVASSPDVTAPAVTE